MHSRSRNERWGSRGRGGQGLVLLLISLALTPLPIANATLVPEDGLTVEGMTTYYAMVTTADFVFLSPGPEGSKIAVMDPTGRQLGSISQVPGAAGLAVVDGILYVAVYSANRIDRFDISTFPPTKLASFSTAPLVEPRDLAYAGGRLVFTSKCGSSSSKVGSMPIDDGAPVTTLSDPGHDWDSCTAIDESPYAPDRIFLRDGHVLSSDLHEYDVSTDVPTFVAAASPGWSDWYSSSPVEPLPGGELVAVPGDVGKIRVFRLADLSGTGDSYDSGGTAALVSTHKNGGLLASAVSGFEKRDITIWRLGDPQAIATYNLPDSAPESRIFTDGLAFSPNGNRLYAVSGYRSGHVVFRTLGADREPELQLDLSSRRIPYGESVHIRVRLTGGTTNREVVVFGNPVNGPPYVAGIRDVGDDGKFKLRDRPEVNTEYSARYEGDEDWLATDSSLTVEVEHVVTGTLRGEYRTEGRYAFFHDDQEVRYLVHVTPPHPDGRATVDLDYNFGSGWQNAGAEKFGLSDTGWLLLVFGEDFFPRGGRYRLRAWMPADGKHETGVSPWAYFRVTA